jgi:hypothetical protein
VSAGRRPPAPVCLLDTRAETSESSDSPVALLLHGAARLLQRDGPATLRRAPAHNSPCIASIVDEAGF